MINGMMCGTPFLAEWWWMINMTSQKDQSFLKQSLVCSGHDRYIVRSGCLVFRRDWCNVCPMPHSTKVWLDVLANMKLDLNLQPLRDAFQNNDLELFKGALSNILNNLSIHDLLTIKAKVSLVGKDLHVGGIFNGAPEMIVVAVALGAFILSFAMSSLVGVVSLGIRWEFLILSLSCFAFYCMKAKPTPSDPLSLVPTVADQGRRPPLENPYLSKVLDLAEMSDPTRKQTQLALRLVAQGLGQGLIWEMVRAATEWCLPSSVSFSRVPCWWCWSYVGLIKGSLEENFRVTESREAKSKS